MATTYYIDGYNVLHKSRMLRPLMDTDAETAREGLLDKVAHFCSTSQAKVIVIFDGRSKQIPETVAHHRSVKNLVVRYAPHHITADTLIEREVYSRSNRLDVVVVSNDRGLRDLCSGMGALTMEADSFLTTCRESRTETSRAVTRQRKEQPAFIEDSLDPEALDKLKALRDRLK